MKLHRSVALLLALAMLLPMVGNAMPVRATQTSTKTISGSQGNTEIYDLSVNNMVEPVGVEADPAFSWKMRSDAIGAAQSAYCIKVTSQTGNVVWNTGWVQSGDSTDIPYGGAGLVSSTQYTVQVTVKDQTGKELAPISTTFETGLLEADAFADASFISHQTGYISDTTVYTIDFDFVIDKAGQGLCFGMKDSGTFVMWQVNANNNASTNKTVILRPHFKSNGGWTAYPGGPGNLQAVDLTAAIGYNTDEILGKTVHERIVVNGRNIKTYFGKDADSLTLAYDYTHSAEIPLYNLGFRHDNSMATSIPETSYYDNIVVTDAAGNVIYSNDFSKNVTVQGTSCYEQKDGKLYVYARGEQVGILMTGEVANANSLPAFRKSIDVKSGLKSAKLYTSGLGVYESYINGERVGTKKGDTILYDELKPGFTDANDRMFYSSYDVTWMLTEGENVLSSMVTTGWWSGGGILHQGNEMGYLAKLLLIYEDGTEIIVTDTSWKTAKTAPVLENTGIYVGEDYDATVDTSWMLPGYNDGSWNFAKINTEFKGELSAWSGPAVRVREDLELSPKTMQVYEGITGASDGYYGKVNVIATYKDGQDIVLHPGQTLLVNFGQNFAGREAFTITSQAGTTIHVDHAEWLNDQNGQISRGNDGPEGSLYTANYRGARAETNYTTAGGKESWHPTFTFYGFQYIAVTADKTVTIHDIRGEVLTSVQGDTGTLTTSDEDVNRLISNARWGMYSNYLSIPTDCPQRDERMGWTADTQVFSQTGMFLGNNKAFLEKAVADMRDSQYTDPNSEIYGAYPDVAPDRGWSGDGGFGWADAGIIVPYNLYMMYGDVSVIEESWDSMCLYMDAYLANQPYGGNNKYSDHLCYETQTITTQNMLSLSFHCWDALMMVEMAKAIGNTQAAAKYQAVFEAHKRQYQNEFVNTDGTLVADTQTTSLYALYVGLLPNEESENKVVDMLIANIQRNGNKLQTGFLGTAILLPTLTKIGRADVAYSLLLQRGDPSWLYSVDQGATTFWERWNTYTVASGFGSAGMNSFNHYAYGAVIGWIYNQAAGIGYDAETPGFKHIVLAPNPDPLVKMVDATYDSAYGPIVSNMRYEGESWIYEAQIPANTTATIHVPVEQIETLVVNGKTPADVTLANDGLVYKGYADGIATFESVAGSYSFETYAAARYRITLNSTTADFMMPPVEAEITMNGQTKKVALPTTVTVSEGTEVAIKAIPMNPVDYAAAGWTDGENKLSETDTVTFTASGDLALTVGTRNIGRHSLAVGKTVIAEQVNDDWAAKHLTDGQYNHLGGVNGWSSYGKGSSTTFASEVPVVIDLGAKTEFNRIHLYPRTYPPANVNFPTAYTIYTSDDNATWTMIYTTANGEVTNGYAPVVIELTNTANARYIKLGVTAVNKADETGGCLVQLSELGVYNVSAEIEEASSYTVDFNESADEKLFDLYSSANGGFAVSDGKLIPTGDGGEFKAVYKDNGQSVRSVSVELHPDGTTGKINAGLYINASNPGNNQDQINALYVGIESAFEGWTDAPNRIDLVIGSFPTWKEHARVISESGNNNNLFSQGVKEPIILRVDMIGNMITVTVSLVRAPSICFGTTYVTDVDLSQGQVGIRSQYSTVKFDNFTVVTDALPEEMAASVGGIYFTSVVEAAEAAGDQTVCILKDTDEAITISKDLTMDLAGNHLTNVTVESGSLNLIDTVSGGSAVVNGNVPTMTEADGKSYYVANDNGVYSAHSYEIKLTHISLDPTNDALGYKAELIGDDVVKAHVKSIGFNLWVSEDMVVTKTIDGKTAATLRLKNILKNGGGEMIVYGNAFVIFDAEQTITSADYGTSMKEVMQLVNKNWSDYTQPQKNAVKALCDQYFDTVSAWELDNVYPIDNDGGVAESYEALTGSFSVNSIGGFTVNGKLTAPAIGEGKVILEQTPAGGIQSVSVDIYPGSSNAINSGLYLGASNASEPQDSIEAIAIMLESNIADNPNRVDIVVGNFPKWQEYHRTVTEAGTALFSGGKKEPVNLTVALNGNTLTITVKLLSDPSKSVTTTYTYTGGYDLTKGQVGLRSQYSDSSFDNFRVNDVTYTFDDEAAVQNLSFYHSVYASGIQIQSDDTLMLHTSASFTEGMLGTNVNTSGSQDVGIIFGANEDCSSYYLYRVATASQYAELVKVENGTQTVLDRGFHICPGYLDIRLELVIRDGMVYCYYSTDAEKARCYAVSEVELFGDRIGLWAKSTGTTFRDVTITACKENRKADVLIFGHSYTEMWTNYASYFPEYSSIYDIGIGGTVAAHWASFTDEIIAFQPKLGIFNIGINDLSSGITPESAVESMEKVLLEVKAALPEFEVVLVSVNHCPTKGDLVDQIAQINALMRNLAASYDWMYYAEAEYLFCTNKTDPFSADPNLFIDGLHPAAEGYARLAEVIRSAIKGENQPELDEVLAQTQFERAKANKLASLGIYSENAYTAENWALAQSHYNAAMAKIEACTTIAQLTSLDLSAEIAALKAIPNKSVNLISNLVNPDTRDALSADSWTKANDHTVHVNGFSYALDNTKLCTDSEMVFRLTNNIGDVATGGVFLRATQKDNNGIEGYLINCVTGGNFLQVWYVNNVYNTDGSAYVLTYLGGIIYGSYGSVADTEFYAKIEGDKLYLSTMERYENGCEPMVVIDLTYGGQYQVFQSGYTGVLSWNDNVPYDLEISHFAG